MSISKLYSSPAKSCWISRSFMRSKFRAREIAQPQSKTNPAYLTEIDKILHMARLVRILCCLCVVASCLLSAQEQPATPASARDFVRRFYVWYVPLGLGNHREPSFNIAIREKRSEFSPDLYQALKNDADAQRKAQGDIVGLDFDPFLNTQDTCKRYDVGNATPAGSAYRVEVFGICSGKRSATPDVLAEVRWADAHWEFVNFIYPDMKDHPDMANLRAVLKSLQQERQKNPQ